MLIAAGLALAGDYERFVATQVREETVYQEAYAAMILKAVWLDGPTKEAQAAKLIAMGSEADATVDPAYVVVFGAYSHWKAETKVSGDASTPWIAKAWVAGTECRLIDVTETKKVSPWDRALYPFLSRWDTLWTARFDRACGEGGLTFALQGPRGKAEVRWGG